MLGWNNRRGGPLLARPLAADICLRGLSSAPPLSRAPSSSSCRALGSLHRCPRPHSSPLGGAWEGPHHTLPLDHPWDAGKASPDLLGSHTWHQSGWAWRFGGRADVHQALLRSMEMTAGPPVMGLAQGLWAGGG